MGVLCSMHTTFFMSSKLGSLGTASKKGGRYSSTMPMGCGTQWGGWGAQKLQPYMRVWGVQSSAALWGLGGMVWGAGAMLGCTMGPQWGGLGDVGFPALYEGVWGPALLHYGAPVGWSGDVGIPALYEGVWGPALLHYGASVGWSGGCGGSSPI